jgi:hypothetical protein
MAEKDLMRVEVIDMDPTIFQMMLHYIYTDSMPPCRDDGGDGYNAPARQHLLVAVDRYGLDRLKQMCEEEECKKMDAETVTTTLALADQHQCERLKKACVEFMASSEVMAAVIETRGFKEHLKTCSRPSSLKRRPRQKRQPSIQRKYHTPLLIDSGESAHIGNKNNLSFELFWMRRDGFFEMVRDEWISVHSGNSPVEIWQHKVRHLRQFLRGWAKNLIDVYRKEK